MDSWPLEALGTLPAPTSTPQLGVLLEHPALPRVLGSVRPTANPRGWAEGHFLGAGLDRATVSFLETHRNPGWGQPGRAPSVRGGQPVQALGMNQGRAPAWAPQKCWPGCRRKPWGSVACQGRVHGCHCWWHGAVG